MNHYTRFRAYQLPNKGSSFSLRVDNHFTLMEARYNELNREHIEWELSLLKRSDIDVLHITSWDIDHCNYRELCSLLRNLIPTIIEYPSEQPTTDNGKKSLAEIKNYAQIYSFCKLIPVTPEVVRYGLRLRNKGQDVFYNPRVNGLISNDNSVAKLFRVGSQALMQDEILRNEVDIMILAHHGADNGFTSIEFLRAINPLVCICAANYSNEYEHPKPVIRARCSSLGIPLFTTKRGDIIAQTVDSQHFKVSNYVSNNEKRETLLTFANKTSYEY